MMNSTEENRMTRRVVSCIHIDGLVQREGHCGITGRGVRVGNGGLGQPRQQLLDIALSHRSTGRVPWTVAIPE